MDIENIMLKSEIQSTRAAQRHQAAAYALFISVMLQLAFISAQLMRLNHPII